MNFVKKPEPKIAESTQKALNRLDRLREAMGLSTGELNKLIVSILGSNAPEDYRQMNSSQAHHVIRYIARNGARILLERSKARGATG
jgi:hypothetical protein